MTAEAPARVELSGTAVDTVWVGPKPEAAPTTVLLHDEAANLAAWGSWPDQLAAATGTGVLRYSRADGQPPRDALDLLGALLDHAAIRRAVLVGHGAGASLALLYAGSRPDHRVRGVALLGPRLAGAANAADLFDAVGHIRVPILAVAGEGAAPAEHEAIAAAVDEAYCPMDVVRVPGAGAAPHREALDATHHHVTTFITTLLDVFGEKDGHVP